MTADDYPTLASLDAHIAVEAHELKQYERRLSDLTAPTEQEWRRQASELLDCIEITTVIIDDLLDLRIIKAGAAA